MGPNERFIAQPINSESFASARRRVALGGLGLIPLTLLGCGRTELEPTLAAGVPLPALELPEIDRAPIRLNKLGRPVLLNFWATWCPPCRAEMGGLDRLYRDLKNAGLAVMGVSVDSDANLVREFILQQGIAFPILWDRAGEVAQRELGIKTFPTTLLVRHDGFITEVIVGERDWDDISVRNRIRALL